MINAVIFDLDDTLYAEHQFVLSGFRAVGEWVEINYAVSKFYEVVKELFEKNHRGNIFDCALSQLNISYDSHIIEALVQVYRQHKPVLSLYKDAAWAIHFFGKTKKLGIITDGYLETQKNKVDALGLNRILDTIVYSDEDGRSCWKPSKVPYIKAMERLGCNTDECIYIGDNPTKDFVTAKALGWSTVQICRGEGEYSGMSCEYTHQPDIKISSLFELKGIIV